MKYDVISADCHIDLIWLPPDLFTANAPAALKDRMPFVTDGERGKEWVTKKGASFGLMNGMGSAGRLYEPGKIHRSDRMASEGIYDDGKKGIRRMTDPALRIKDQDRDGIQAEVSLRHPRRHQPDQRRRSRRRDAAHLQRVARRVLQHPSRPLCRARLHSQPRHRRRGRRDRAGGAARRRARPRNLAARRHDAAVGPLVEPDVGCGRGLRAAGAFPYDRQRYAGATSPSLRQRWRSPPAPPASPASRCTCRTS